MPSAAYTHRITTKTAEYNAKYPQGLTGQGQSAAEAKAYARGHARVSAAGAVVRTAEHGRVQQAPPPVSNATTYTARSAQAIEKVLRQAAKNGQRVSLAVTDKANPNTPVTTFENRQPGHNVRGIPAQVVVNQMKAQNQTFRRYVDNTTFSKAGGRRSRSRKKKGTPGYKPQGITSITITVYGQ